MLELVAPAEIMSSRLLKSGVTKLNVAILDTVDPNLVEAVTGAGVGWLAFKPNQLEAPPLEKKEAEAKLSHRSPSERLYRTIYALWIDTDQSQEFESYYDMKMNQIIDALKRKLPHGN